MSTIRPTIIAQMRMLLVATACLLSSNTFASSPSDWPAFRGPNGDGIYPTSSALAHSDGFGLKIKWKKTIGSGYSGVAVANGLVVTMFSDGKEDVVIAFDEETGAEKWRYVLGETYKGHDGSHTGPISTPAVSSSGQVFALAPRGRLVALDAKSGKETWSTELVDDHEAKKPHYGFTTSPIIMDNMLIVQMGAEKGSVAGFNMTTGERVWQACEDSVQYQSPIPYRMDRLGAYVLAVGDKKIVGLSPRTGEILWEHEHGGGGARGVGSATPVPAGKNRLFLAYKDDESTIVTVTPTESAVDVKTVWTDRSIKNSYNVPVYHDGYVYAYSSRFLTCVDAETGKSVWRSRQPGDGFLILVDQHLVIQTKEGGVHIAKASPDGYKELAHAEVFSDLSWSPPSFAKGSIFTRSMGEIARIDIQSGSVSGTPAVAVAEDLSSYKFGQFLATVEKASDKKAVVDRFIASQKQFPIIEGSDRIHFVYRGEADDVAVAGDIFGARQETSMTHVSGTDLFYYSMKLEPDARTNYVFLKDYDQILDPRNERKTKTIVYGKEMEMSFRGDGMEMSWVAMPAWKPARHLGEPQPARRGRVEKREMESEHLESKYPVHVYLPAGYDDSDARYPVAFVHGGKAAREKGMYVTSLDNLIGQSVAPVIVVFIELRPSATKGKYPQLFANELIPFIDENFRTHASPDTRASIGAGFSASAALLCAFGEPDVVAKVGSQSSFIFDSMRAQLDSSLKSAEKQPLQIYFDWGKYDLRNPHEAWDLADTNRKLDRLLQDKGYETLGGEANDGTGWSSWNNRTDDMFETLFPLKK